MSLPPQPMIWWGPGPDNALFFNIADSRRPYRRPRMGSVQDVSGAGRPDAWTIGFDYMLDLTARWIPEGDTTWPAQATGMTGLQDFVEWARDGNTFRYVPNAQWPDFWVDGCTLANALELQEALEDTNEQGNVLLTLRNPTFDFAIMERGLFFDYAPGMDIAQTPLWSFSATGQRSYIDRGVDELGGYLRYAASGEIRDRDLSFGGNRVTTLEYAESNTSTQPEALDNVAWTKTLVTITPNSATVGAPDRSLTVDKLVENNDAGPAVHTVHFSQAITASDPLAATIYVKAAERTFCQLYFSDSAAGAQKVGCTVNLTTGALTNILSDGTGTLPTAFISSPKSRLLANGWVEVRWSCRLKETITSAFFVIRMTDNTGNGTYDGDGTSGFYAWGAMVTQDSRTPQSYINGSKNADLLQILNWPWNPQPMWQYTKFVEFGGVRENSGGSVFIVGSPWPMARWDTFLNPGYRFQHATANGVVVVSDLTSGLPIIGDTVELLAIMRDDGSVEARMSVNGAADVTGGRSAPLAFAAAWAVTTVRIAENFPMGLVRTKAGRDAASVFTIADVRNK